MLKKLFFLLIFTNLLFALLRQTIDVDVEQSTTDENTEKQEDTLLAETFNTSKCNFCINQNLNQYADACSETEYPSTCKENFHIYKLMFLQCILSLNCTYQHQLGYSNKCVCQCFNLTENIIALSNTNTDNENNEQESVGIDNQTENSTDSELNLTENSTDSEINSTQNEISSSEQAETEDAETLQVSQIPLEILQQNPAVVNFVECYLQASCGEKMQEEENEETIWDKYKSKLLKFAENTGKKFLTKQAVATFLISLGIATKTAAKFAGGILAQMLICSKEAY